MRLFVFGLGFSACRLAADLMQLNWSVSGTCRSPEKAEQLRNEGFTIHQFGDDEPLADAATVLADCTHILLSIPPGEQGDPVFRHHAQNIAQLPSLQWLGYLSTTGVYGDHQGRWIDESTPVNPGSARSQRRVDAENAWLSLHTKHNVPTHIFRLPGIYGPGRSAIDAIRQGRTQRIDKPGQVFCRIHIDDIAQGLAASMKNPARGSIYNLVDDEPAAPQDITTFAAEIMGMDLPPPIPFEEADLSPMGRSFYAECKRVRNAKMKEELGVALKHPTYRDGLQAVLSEQGLKNA